MRSQWATLFLLSFYFIAVCGATRSNEADRLVAMMHWKPPASLHKEPWVQPNAFSVFIGPQEELMEADRITALPGQPEGVYFSQYSGYVTVDPGAGRALFYYFAEAVHNSSQKPLVLWLNGGPGCSSLGAGAMLELGPFSVNKDGNTLYKNEYAWNNVANMLFLESPAGVGFSYSNTSSDYDRSGDNRTAEDTYTFLINWLERFPQFKGRDFFITGESYAGHYIPELANVIIANNNKMNATTVNLKGIAIGNAYVDDDTNLKGNYEYRYTHALISKEAHEAIQANCNFTGHGSHSPECQKGLDLAADEIGMIDAYNIYAPVCPVSGSVQSDDLNAIGDPCVENYIYSYLNLAEVQNSLHANTSLGYKWSECSDFISFGNWNDTPVSMLPAIKQVIDSGISVWLYSGDIDSVVSVTATQYFLDDLNLPIEASWRPWYNIDDGGFSLKDIDIDRGQVGGYVVGYKGLVFATVRGAGHMVPKDRPESALILFSSFLQGKLPPA